MRAERKKDRESTNPVVCFDLQNVLSCSKGEISNFFYKSKIDVYNLTAHLSTTKQVYCPLWSEELMGRNGNEIASALIRILKAVFTDNPKIKDLRVRKIVE